MTRRLRLFLLAIVPMCMIVALFALGRYAKTRKSFQAPAEEKKMVASWQSLPMTPIADQTQLKSDLSEHLRSMKFKTTPSGLQLGCAITSLMTLFRAYHEGTFDTFCAFRMPTNTRATVDYDPTVMRQLALEMPPSSAFAQWARRPGVVTPHSILAAFFESYWRAWRDARIQKTGERAICVDCWQGIALDSLAIEFEDLKAEPPSLRIYVAHHQNLGGFDALTPIVIHPTIKELLANGKTVRVMYVSFVVNTSTRRKAYPIYVRYYWVPDLNTWVPDAFDAGINSEVAHYIF